ncbi:hypothetical protein KBD49_09460 [Myxococcota bacterium]|nr:hypothetical protein [Myxococcota bacterium]
MTPRVPGHASPPPALRADMVREHLGKGRRISLRAGGLSMVPLLPPGVVLTLRPLESGEEPPPGTLVVLVIGEHLVCHLLRERRQTPSGSQVRTAGLLPDQPDPWVPASEILGIACEVRIGSRAAPLDGLGFRTWQALSEELAPALRALKRVLRPLLPPEVREKVYRLLATPFGP